MTLKDKTCQIRAVMWRTAAARLPFSWKMDKRLFARVESKSIRRAALINCHPTCPAQGARHLQLAFQQLHKRLAGEGLFDPDRKRPLPRFPVRVGFVTSPQRRCRS